MVKMRNFILLCILPNKKVQIPGQKQNCTTLTSSLSLISQSLHQQILEIIHSKYVLNPPLLTTTTTIFVHITFPFLQEIHRYLPHQSHAHTSGGGQGQQTQVRGRRICIVNTEEAKTTHPFSLKISCQKQALCIDRNTIYFK